jgi:small subunit ribosomal protein S17
MRKKIGIDVKSPEGKCEDKHCPWHGRLAIRGRVFNGVVRSAKSHQTVVVEWGYHKFVPKYERYERRKSRVAAHNPECIKAKEGDGVVVAECKPLSKTKHFVIVAKVGEGFFEIKGEEQKVLMKKKGKKEESKEEDKKEEAE